MTDVLLRLRPIVHATPTETGLHVRGWSSSFSLEGGKGLWTVWERLAGPLATGVPPEQLAVPPGASPAMAAALDLIIGQLHEHDLLVRVPVAWGTPGPDVPPPDIASWLESVAGDPADAWRRLRSTTVTVIGEGALAAAAYRALTSSGLTVHPVVPGDDLIVIAGRHVVAAGWAAEVGYVVRPGIRDQVVADARAVAQRLGAQRSGAQRSDAPEVLAALIGSAAAHRLVCALGGLPDPATETVNMWDETPTPELTHQAVLVARLDPLRAEYHPFLSAARPCPAPADPLRALDVIGDAELGPVPTPEMGSLPQLPVKLAASGEIIGYGTTTNAARLDAMVRACQAIAPPSAIVGADRTHALGLALRHAARASTGTPVAEEAWLTDPTARRWWKAVTLRFALPATLEVTHLDDRVFRAEVLVGQRVLAWAVEATAADAVAFAALGAAGATQAGVDEPIVLCGALPLENQGAREWYWPADVRDSEAGLQDDLRVLLDVEPKPVALGPVLDAAGIVAFAVPIRVAVAR
jgi:hypothetical protein